MARKTKKAPAKARKRATKAKTRARKPRERAVILRRNAAPTRARSRPKDEPDEEENERRPLTERMEDMGPSHVVAAVAGGSLANVAGVVATAQGWIGPKWAAGSLMGGGLTTAAAGWYWDSDHAMATGAGIAAAGAFSIVNQLAVDAYEAMEKKAQEKRARKKVEEEKKEREQRLAEARTLLDEEAKKKGTRNARRIVVLDQEGEPIDAEFEEIPNAA